MELAARFASLDLQELFNFGPKLRPKWWKISSAFGRAGCQAKRELNLAARLAAKLPRADSTSFNGPLMVALAQFASLEASRPKAAEICQLHAAASELQANSRSRWEARATTKAKPAQGKGGPQLGRGGRHNWSLAAGRVLAGKFGQQVGFG